MVEAIGSNPIQCEFESHFQYQGRLVKWHNAWFATKDRQFDSDIVHHTAIAQRIEHLASNQGCREFKSLSRYQWNIAQWQSANLIH